MKKTVSIIGAGIAGMTAGIYLQEHGYDVTIFEKNANPGGFLTGWTRKNQFIDGCLHWLIGTKDGTNLNKMWKHLGALENVNIIPINSFYKVVYEGKTLTFYSDIDKLEKELYSHSEGDDELIKEFVAAIRYVGVLETQTEKPFDFFTTSELMHSMIPFIKLKRFANTLLEDYANEYHSEILKFAFKHALTDKKFNVMYLIQTLGHFCAGNAFVPEGGSLNMAYRMINKFISFGGKIKYCKNVSKIIVKNNTAKGIVINNENVYSDYVISASDLHFTFEKLLENKYPFEPLSTYDSNKAKFPTYSFVLLSYKTRKDISYEDVDVVLKVPTINSFNKEHEHVSIRHYGYDESLKTDGYTTIEVMVNTYEEDYEYIKSLSKDEYKAFKQDIGNKYLSILKEYFKTDDIEMIDSLTPLTFERYLNAYKGTFMTYALGPKMNQVMMSNKSKDVENLYFANQWLVIPGGTCIAVTMGKFAAQHIMKNDGLDYTNLD